MNKKQKKMLVPEDLACCPICEQLMTPLKSAVDLDSQNSDSSIVTYECEFCSINRTFPPGFIFQ